MMSKEKARELAMEIFKLQREAAKIPVFLSLPLVKKAAQKQTELNMILVEDMNHG